MFATTDFTLGIKGLALSLCLTCLACANTATSGRNSLGWLDGRWRGVALEVERDKTWSIKLEANVRRQRYEIEYPSENCSGTWQLVDSDACKARFAETITNDRRNNCVNGTIIVTRLDQRTISYTWFRDEKAVASAFLTKD